MAVLDGDTNLETLFTTGKAKLEFICHDPYLYSLENKVFSAENKLVTIENEGNAETYPYLSINFFNPACFFQATNTKGETILIGTRPDIDKPSVSDKAVGLKDDCTTTSNWQNSGNVVDSNREVTGTASVGMNGSAIICNNFGSSNASSGANWHGCGVRRNIGANIEEFEVKARMIFSSTGKNNSTGGSGGSGGSSLGTYKVVNAPAGLRIRQEPNTTSKILSKLSNGKQITALEIKNGWCKHTTGGVTGWSSLEYLQKVATNGTKKQVQNISSSNVNIRKSASTKGSIVGKLPKNAKADYIEKASTGWYKVKYNSITGYVSNDSKLTKVITVSTRTTKEEEIEYAESQLGVMELYGFDNNGQKLFKFCIRDVEEYFEFNQPEVYIGGSCVLKDSSKVPAPTVIIEKKNDDDEGTKKTIASGVYGKWNDFEGVFSIKRTKNSKDEYQWTATVDKIVNGKVTQTMSTSNNLVNSNYPKGALNNVVLFIGKHKEHIQVAEMGLLEVNINQLNKVNVEKQNVQIFKAGDILEIDNASGEILLNGLDFLEQLDIGSQFFEVPSGISNFGIASDDNDIQVNVGIQERWL